MMRVYATYAIKVTTILPTLSSEFVSWGFAT